MTYIFIINFFHDFLQQKPNLIVNFSAVETRMFWENDVNSGDGDGLAPPGVSALRTLTHCGLMTPYGDIDLGQHWFR